MDIFRLGLGVISIIGGVSALNRGLSHLGAGLGRTNGSAQTKVIKRRKRTLPTLHRGRHVPTSAGPVRVTLKSVGSLDDRLEAIMENAEKGKFDPEVIAWARQELTKKCGGGWNGEQWCVPRGALAGGGCCMEKIYNGAGLRAAGAERAF